jgi:predicted metal-dependent hydrolase
MRESMTFPQPQLIRSKRKTIALIVKPDGSLVVRAPLRSSNAVIEDFVKKNAPWIERKQAEALAALPAPTKQYVNGATFPYLGTNYPLEIVEQPGVGVRRRRASDRRSPKLVTRPLLLDVGGFKLAASHQHGAASAFERWYREQARQVLAERVKFFAAQYGFQYKRIRITSARTRWGSCSASGSLSFSWRLIQAPLAVVDYVVVHELVHTVVHNHSKQFWQRVGSIMPDYHQHRRWLREHGRELLV